jgi:methyl-accepting chemotaxis protein
MADTAVLRVDVASTDFDKFQTSFNQYAKALQDTLATWSKITTEVKAASAVMTNMVAPVARSTASLQKFTQQFSETSKHSTAIRTNVESITKGLVSWRTAVGSTMALLGLGGGGLWGLTSLVNSTVGDRAKALGAGVGYGQFRGMNAGSFPGAGAAITGWGTARWDPTSGAYRGAQTLFGQDTNRQLARTDPLAMADALEKATKYLGQFDEKIRGTIAATSGLNDLLGPEAIRTWMALDKEEIEVRRKAIKAAGDAAAAAEEANKKWATFQITLESSKSVIQDVLINKLAPLARPLTDLSAALTKVFTTFMETEGVRNTIKHFGDEMQKWADWLQTTEGQESFNRFMEKLGKAAEILATFVDTIARIIGLVARSPIGKGVGALLGAVPGAVQGLEKNGIGSSHFGPATQDDINRNLQMGYDKYGAKINPDGSSANFPNPGDALKAATDPKVQSTPWWKQKNFGFSFSSKDAASGTGDKPQQELMGATGILGGGQYMEWFKGWFVQEQQSTKAAARAAADRDESTQRLMGNLDNYFMTEAERQEKLNRTLEDFNAWLNKMGVGGGGGTGPGGAALGPGTGGGAGGPQGAGGSGPHSRTSSAGGPGGGGSGGFLDAVANIESSNRNIVQGIHDVNTDKGTPASGYFQIIDPTWRKYAAKAGVDLAKYPTPMSAPRDVQAQVAAAIPANQFGGRTQRMLHEQFGEFDKNKTLGELNEQFGGGGAAGAMANATPNSTSEIRGPGGGNAADANALLAEVKKTHPHLSNEQCVTLVREFTGMGGTVRDWRKGSNVLSGNMKVGTPIATFMSASGQQSERYDAGGIGTPGAGTSHAALFGGYTRDQSGKITGINVVEQYKGSKGPRTQHYGIGGFGEHGAENYFGIAGAGGGKQRSGGTNGLDNDNWQQKPINNVNIHNRTGSDVHIAASTVMASS